jgi:3-deoxy-D-manno-octulosonic-acid transferase
LKRQLSRPSSLSRLLGALAGGLTDLAYAAAGLAAFGVRAARGQAGIALDHWRRRALEPPPERAGERPCLWLHGVSVGEVLALRRIVGRLEEELRGWDLVVSSSTAAGLDSARLHFSGRLVISYPLDLTWIVRRAFDRLRPDAVVIVEHDLWPNFLRQARLREAPVALINARLSPRALRGYRRLACLLRWPPRALEVICAQDETSAAGYRELGFPASKVHVTGNLKFDHAAPPPAGLREELGLEGGAWLLVAGSTHAGEEEPVLAAYERLRREAPTRPARLIIVPRRTERAGEVAALARGRGFAVGSWSRPEERGADVADVVVVDTVGELARIAAAADAVFVGGSLVPIGGHNVIEPASAGRPVLLGPHFHNQKSIVTSFLERQALIVVKDGGELAAKVLELHQSPELAAQLGERARRTVLENAGAVERTVEVLLGMLRREAAPDAGTLSK